MEKDTVDKPSIVPEQPTAGQNAARVVTDRDDGKGGALPLAEQPGVAPDYPFQGTPPNPAGDNPLAEPPLVQEFSENTLKERARKVREAQERERDKK